MIGAPQGQAGNPWYVVIHSPEVLSDNTQVHTKQTCIDQCWSMHNKGITDTIPTYDRKKFGIDQ